MSEMPLKRYLFASDFDQTLTFDDSGYVLSELVGIPTAEFENTVSQTVQGTTFDAGIGLKLYANRWLAVRFDLRDYVILQEAVAVQRVTNNIVGPLGLSLFIPGPRS